ncbi:C39 family peptidase [Paenibacillus kobensis]|uniref:C39 family peptidase n=1 Tax=Paenibacillus kobensis TaxID=59841 RepID=UPI0013E3C69A|nr:C39 family peptidase [Paenibacillus kobensis]
METQHELTETITVSYPIPFYSQQVDLDDANLQGFKSKEQAEHWQVRGCGIASVRMIIDGFQLDRSLPLSKSYGELVYEGVETGAYCDRGWIHKGLVDIAGRYDVKGRTFRQSSVTDILSEIENNRPCIASVSARFNGGKLDSNGEVIQPGGHLIVVTGAVRKNGLLHCFIVNHPSFNTHYNWANHCVPIDDFSRSFSGAFMSFG